jgi:hypothetical protein
VRSAGSAATSEKHPRQRILVPHLNLKRCERDIQTDHVFNNLAFGDLLANSNGKPSKRECGVGSMYFLTASSRSRLVKFFLRFD